MRPFGVAGEPPGSMSSSSRVSLISQPPAVPGGTLVNVRQAGATNFAGPVRDLPGTGSYITRESVLGLAGNASRGTGFAGTRAPEGLVYAGARRAGVRSNRSLLGAIAQSDIRNPYVARHLLGARMVAGSTRYR